MLHRSSFVTRLKQREEMYVDFTLNNVMDFKEIFKNFK